MTESILNSIKKMLGIPVTDTAFDTDLIININSVFMVLYQLGVGTETVYAIEDSTQNWSAFLTDVAMYSAVKTYMYLKLRLVFDPPGTSFLLEAINKQIAEHEWRLTNQVPIPTAPVVESEEP